MKKHIYDTMMRAWLVLMALALPVVTFADEDPGNVDDAESAAMARTKQNAPTWQETDPNGANYLQQRRALVGTHCSVNRVMNIVSVGTGTSGLENLTNEDISDFASLPQVVGATVAVSPTVSIRDMKNYYAAGTTGGFCVVASSGSSVLSLDLVRLMQIWFYKDGKLVSRKTVSEYNESSGVKLSLIGIPGSEDACVNLTAVSDRDFDEVALVQAGGVDAQVGAIMKVKYAFVGQAHDVIYRPSDLQTYCAQNAEELGQNYYSTLTLSASAFPATGSLESRIVDEDITNHCDLPWVLLAVGTTGTAQVNVTSNAAEKKNLFHKGDQVGFRYTIVTALDLVDLGESVIIKLYDIDGNEVQSTTVSASVLNLGLASGGDMTTYLIADADFTSAKIEFITGVKLLSGGSHNMYYAFVRPQPEIDHQCPINASGDTNLCDSQGTYQLKSNPDIPVTWSVESQPADNNNACTVTADGFVQGMNAEGEYKFRATAEDGCYEIMTIHHGSTSWEQQPMADHPLINVDSTDPVYALSDDLHGETSANVLSISDMINSDNVINSDITDCAEYTRGLQLLGSNGVIVGVKQIKEVDGSKLIYDGSKADAKESIHVGFVIEMQQTVLGVNLLNALQIRCFDEDGNKVYEHIVEDAGVLGANIIGNNDKSNKLRLAITVPKVNGNGQPVKINEIQLWKIGTLDLTTNDVKFYYAFWDDPTDARNNVIRDGAYVVNYDNMGATVNVGTQVNVASVGGVVNNLSNIIDIDDELETYALLQKTVESGSTEIIVNLGRTFDYRHQVGVVVNNDIVALNANVGSVIKIGTFCAGNETGEASSNWGVIGANVIQGSGKTVLLIQPSSDYDEIHITAGEGLAVNRTIKIYGILLRNDIDHDGVSDVRDDSSCPNASVVNISTNNVCLDETLTLSGLGTTGTKYYVSLPDQNYNMQEVMSGQDGNITVSIPTIKDGRYTAFFYDGSQNLIATYEYMVHPKQTTWRTTTTDTDWNRWENWTNGSPYLCTDVIMPSGARAYPSLDNAVVNGDEYGCDRIFFESRAAVEKVFKLNYTKAWVNVQLQPNRYYLLSAPLQDMYTGDMFIANNYTPGNDGVFTELTSATYPQNRFAPRIYQRLWEKASQNKLYGDGYADASINETRWSTRFNYLKYGYATAEGFSMWVDPDGNAADNFSFLFPKNHTVYNYYDVTGEQTDMTEALTRTNNNHRFAYEYGKTAVNYTYKTSDDRQRYDGIGNVTVQSKADGATTTKTFLVGNPFMSHIDVAKFLEANTDLKEVKVYDGNTTTSAIAVGERYLSTDANFKTIMPMEAFFVTLKDEVAATNTLNVTFTEAMFLQNPVEATGNAPAYPMLTVTAKKDKLTATTMLVMGDEQMSSETLFDNEVRPRMALFTLDGEVAHDIRSFAEGDMVPLGIYVDGEGESLTLSFKAHNGLDLSDYRLLDRMTGVTYELTDQVAIDASASSVGRYVLVGRDVTSIDDTVAASGVQIEMAGRTAVVKSTAADMESVTVVTADGKLVDTVKSGARKCSVRLAPGVNIIEVKRDGISAEQYKVVVR